MMMKKLLHSMKIIYDIKIHCHVHHIQEIGAMLILSFGWSQRKWGLMHSDFIVLHKMNCYIEMQIEIIF
jgi:hypothetical protein